MSYKYGDMEIWRNDEKFGGNRRNLERGNMYTAYCPELDVVSCGRNIDEAQKNLLEVIEIQLEETVKLGTLETF